MAVRQVINASSATTVAVPPAARSIAGILVAIGVPDDDLDGVVEVLMSEPELAEHVPGTYKAIVTDCRRAYDLYLRRQLVVVDAESGATPT